MPRNSRLAMTLGLAAALCAFPFPGLAQNNSSPDENGQSYSFDQDEHAGVAAAIHFQKAEDAAAARQARIEAARERGQNSANRMATPPRNKPHQNRGAAERTVPPPSQR